MKVKIDSNNLEFLMWTSMRYCVGRRTGVSSDWLRVLKAHVKDIHVVEREKTLEELKEEVFKANKLGKTIGDQWDHDDWVEAIKILEEINK